MSHRQPKQSGCVFVHSLQKSAQFPLGGGGGVGGGFLQLSSSTSSPFLFFALLLVFAFICAALVSSFGPAQCSDSLPVFASLTMMSASQSHALQSGFSFV